MVLNRFEASFMQYLKSSFGGKKAFLWYVYFLTIGMLIGRYYRYKKVPKSVNRIVFVCKGNICRSAFAEYYFKKISNIPCASFGLNATTGSMANDRISSLSQMVGIDLESHITTAFNDFDFKVGDLFVCMEPNQVNQLINQVPNASVLLLGWFTQSKRIYIHDPYGACDEYAKKSLDVITESVNNLVLALEEASK